MSISKFRARQIIDPAGLRREIIEAFTAADGNIVAALRALKMSKSAFYRLVEHDERLKDDLRKQRERFLRQGVHQRGYGEWHRQR